MTTSNYLVIGYETLKQFITSLVSLKRSIIEYELHSVRDVFKNFHLIETGVLANYILIDNHGLIWDRTRIKKKKVNGLYKNTYIADPESFVLSGENPLICSRSMIFEILEELCVKIPDDDKKIIQSQYESIDSLRFLYGELHPLMVWLKELIDKLIMLQETFKSLNEIVPVKNVIKIDMPLIKKILEFREQLFLYLHTRNYLDVLIKMTLKEYFKANIIPDNLILLGNGTLLFNQDNNDYLEFHGTELVNYVYRYDLRYNAHICYHRSRITTLTLNEKFLEKLIETFHLIYYKAMPMNKTYYEKVLTKLNETQVYDILASFIKFERIIKNEKVLQFARDL